MIFLISQPKRMLYREGSFQHPKHMFKLISKEINAILGAQTILIWTYGVLKQGIMIILRSITHPYLGLC